MPYQPGSTKRAWVHEKTQGIARSVSMPAPLRRDAGREPDTHALDHVNRRGRPEILVEVRCLVDEFAIEPCGFRPR